MSLLPPLPFPLQSAVDLAAASPSCARVQAPQPPPAAAPSALIAHPLRDLGLQRLTHRGERRVRALYASLIVRAARLLELPALTGATAALYFSRFYAQNSLLAHAPALCAAAALFLASKVEENTRRVRDVINVVYRCEHSPPHPAPPPQPHSLPPPPTPLHPYAYSSPLHPSSSSPPLAALAAPSNPAAMPPPLAPSAAAVQPEAEAPDSRLEVSPLFWELKEEVLRFEQKLLRVLGYAMRVTHPHAYVLHFARELECSEELCRLAYYIANDSVRTTLSLQYAPHAIACAAIYLASELSQEQIRYHPTVILGAGETRMSSMAAAAASPYRSPHHSHAASSSGATAAPSSSSTSASALVLSSSAHGSEWWEHFGGVNQLEVEDITHQLLDLFDEGDEDGAAGYGTGHGTRTLLQELERVAEEVHAEIKREAAMEAARNQRIEASVRAGAAAHHASTAAAPASSDEHMSDVHHAPPPHSERAPHNVEGRPAYASSATADPSFAAAPSAATAAMAPATASVSRSLMQPTTAGPSMVSSGGAATTAASAASNVPSYAAAYAPGGGGGGGGAGGGFPSYGAAPSMPSTSITSAQAGASNYSYAPSFSAASPATTATLHAPPTLAAHSSLLPPAARMYSQ